MLKTAWYEFFVEIFSFLKHLRREKSPASRLASWARVSE